MFKRQHVDCLDHTVPSLYEGENFAFVISCIALGRDNCPDKAAELLILLRLHSVLHDRLPLLFYLVWGSSLISGIYPQVSLRTVVSILPTSIFSTHATHDSFVSRTLLLRTSL